MSEALTVECGTADDFGRRSVVAKCGRKEHRDRFNTDDAYRRRFFAEHTLNTFGWAVGADAIAEIEALIVREAVASDNISGGGNMQPRMTRLAEVPPSHVEWLWPGRVALGAVTMLAGDPGLGKSFVTLDMAARVSRGGAWPDEMDKSRESRVAGQSSDSGLSSLDTQPPASVVLFSAEDDLAKTIRPRLEALRANCDRVVAIEAIEGRDEDGAFARPFEMGRDLEHLSAVIEQLGDCRLVIIDPISAFLGRVSENANAEVRAMLAPLAELAAKFNLAVVVVSHLRKDEGAAVYRTMGSMAFVAAARAAWIVVRDPKQSRRRLMLPVKNNLADDVGGLAFTIVPWRPGGVPVVCWDDERIEASCELADGRPTRPAHRPNEERGEVAEWLSEYLADGPIPAHEVRKAAEAHGFSYGTLRRAFRDLRGKASQQAGEKQALWIWQLPTANEPTAQKSAPVLLRSLDNGDAANAEIGILQN